MYRHPPACSVSSWIWDCPLSVFTGNSREPFPAFILCIGNVFLFQIDFQLQKTVSCCRDNSTAGLFLFQILKYLFCVLGKFIHVRKHLLYFDASIMRITKYFIRIFSGENAVFQRSFQKDADKKILRIRFLPFGSVYKVRSNEVPFRSWRQAVPSACCGSWHHCRNWAPWDVRTWIRRISWQTWDSRSCHCKRHPHL